MKRVTPLDVELGKRVRVRRLEQGVSQETLAAKAGITFQQIQKYEAGTNRIAASRLFAIAHALQVPVSYFFNGLSAEPEIGETTPDCLISNDGFALNKAYKAIQSPEKRKAVLQLVRSLAE